jgi:hypothetical protein
MGWLLNYTGFFLSVYFSSLLILNYRSIAKAVKGDASELRTNIRSISIYGISLLITVCLLLWIIVFDGKLIDISSRAKYLAIDSHSKVDPNTSPIPYLQVILAMFALFIAVVTGVIFYVINMGHQLVKDRSEALKTELTEMTANKLREVDKSVTDIRKECDAQTDKIEKNLAKMQAIYNKSADLDEKLFILEKRSSSLLDTLFNEDRRLLDSLMPILERNHIISAEEKSYLAMCHNYNQTVKRLDKHSAADRIKALNHLDSYLDRTGFDQFILTDDELIEKLLWIKENDKSPEVCESAKKTLKALNDKKNDLIKLKLS